MVTIPPQPPDLDDGVRKFLEFNDMDPSGIGVLRMRKLPTKVQAIGQMLQIYYRSDKWEGKPHDYKHDHESGVTLYEPGPPHATKTPSWLQRVGTLVRLGHCLGFAYKHNGTEYEAETNSSSELYCTPCGHALIVIERKLRVDAIIYGGRLRVEAEGIKG